MLPPQYGETRHALLMDQAIKLRPGSSKPKATASNEGTKPFAGWLVPSRDFVGILDGTTTSPAVPRQPLCA